MKTYYWSDFLDFLDNNAKSLACFFSFMTGLFWNLFPILERNWKRSFKTMKRKLEA